MIEQLTDRILARCTPEPNTGCWLWDGTDAGKGYGVISIACRTVRAHRASYEAFVGPIPDGLCVCHRCDTPSCVNPEHLFLDTSQGNTADRVRKRRSARLSNHGSAKLTPAQVAEIRSSWLSQRKLARAFGVTQSNISAVRRGVTWNL